MVEKIPVRIGNVRGLGNIISPSKTLNDYKPVECEISESTEPVYGLNNTVYNMSYHSDYGVILSVSSQSVDCFSPVTLTATVTEESTPVSGATVTFKADNVNIGTANTNSNGVATFEYTPQNVGVIYLTAVCVVSSNNVSLSVNKATPTLTFESSSRIVRPNESITLSGVFSGGEGFDLVFFVGDSSSGQVTTGANGTFSFTYTPTTAGSTQLSIWFLGNTVYNSVHTSVSIAVLNNGDLQLTSNKPILSYKDSDTAVISAQLMDGTSTVPVEGINVDFYIGSTSLQRHYDTYANANLQEMVLTGDGAFQWYNETDWVFLKTADGDQGNALNCESLMGKTVTLLREGNVLKVYVDDVDRSDLLLSTLYSKSNLTIEPWRGPISNINLFNTADKDNFCEKIGSDDTDSTGLASVSYASRGIGDIKVMAICGILVSKIYEVQDCWKYDGTEHTETFSSSLANPILYDVGTSDCIVELDVQTSGYYYLVGLGYFSGSTLTEHISYGASSANTGSRWISATRHDDVPYNSSYYTLKWVRTSNNMKLYLNGTLITDTTQSMVTTLNKLLISSWNSKTIKYKNLKVKPL